MFLQTSISHDEGGELRSDEDTDVVLLRLEPIQGLFSAIGTVSRDRVRLSIGWVSTTATSNLGSGKADGGDRVGDTTLESVHVVCVNIDKTRHTGDRR